MPAPDIPPRTTGKVDTEFLDFDPDNPRLIEAATTAPSDSQIIQVLADTSDLSEIVESLAANGYIDIEPLIAQKIQGRFRVLEGNRRLAAIRILLNPDLATGTGIAVPELVDAVRASLKTVTVYAVANPDQARDFIGFKHINGPHKWDAHAKGRFAADWYEKEKDQGLTLKKIAQRLGDRHDTVVRLVNGIVILDQAENARVFSLQDRYPGRKFAFSHLYTALTRPGYRDFLGLPDEWRTLGSVAQSCSDEQAPESSEGDGVALRIQVRQRPAPRHLAESPHQAVGRHPPESTRQGNAHLAQ